MFARLGFTLIEDIIIMLLAVILITGSYPLLVNFSQEVKKEIDQKRQREHVIQEIIDSAIEVQKNLGPGLLESVYEDCLCIEFEKKKLAFKRKVPLSCDYKGIKFENVSYMDIIVENQILIEVKAVEKVLPTHETQILTYLKLSKIPLGLLMNFHENLSPEKIKRFIYEGGD